MLQVNPHPDCPLEEGRYIRGNDSSPAAVAIMLNCDADKIPPDNEAPPAHRLKSRAMKLAIVLALGLVLLITVFAVPPPLRSWAQEVLARTGALIITDAPTYAERSLPIPQTTTPMYSQTQESESLSQEEASRRAGFTILIPRALPKKEQDIYKPERRYKDVLALIGLPPGILVLPLMWLPETKVVIGWPSVWRASWWIALTAARVTVGTIWVYAVCALAVKEFYALPLTRSLPHTLAGFMVGLGTSVTFRR